ncbi:uncharacterized protein [Euwallacea fornicatus]|uniref:uncharacterized protein n=1 Tax=Euwallacea fornicatus TaxID=995702 RepID=UPI00338D8A3D
MAISVVSNGVANLILFSCTLMLFYEFASSTTQNNGSLQYHYVCPDNFENVGRKCYHFSNTTATWFQAYFSCKDFAESNLTVITQRYDQRQVEHYLFKTRNQTWVQNSSSFWVGGFKDWKQKKWIYTDGSLMQFPASKEIHLSDRDNWTCLLIDSLKKRWSADNCMERRPFICEAQAVASVLLSFSDKKAKRRITVDECVSNHYKLTKKQRRKCMKLLHGNDKSGRSNEPAAVIQRAKPGYQVQPTVVKAVSHICHQNWMALGNQCYLFSKEKATWSDAHFNCRQINAKLAIVRTKTQDQKLRIFLNGFAEKSERWIGGRYNTKIKEWIWALSGKPLGYKGFVQEPSSNSTDNLEWQAIVMDPQYAYKWSHRNELDRHLYICQVKGTPVKRLSYPRGSSATIQINHDRGHPRKQYEGRPRNQNSRRTNRNHRS